MSRRALAQISDPPYPQKGTFWTSSKPLRNGNGGHQFCDTPTVEMRPVQLRGRKALRSVKKGWFATDCDRDRQRIGQEIHKPFDQQSDVVRVLFTAQHPQTIQNTFHWVPPNHHYARPYVAAVTRSHANQIYDLVAHRYNNRTIGPPRTGCNRHQAG